MNDIMTPSEKLVKIALHPLFIIISSLIILFSYFYLDLSIAEYICPFNFRQVLAINLLSAAGKWPIPLFCLLILMGYQQYVRHDPLMAKKFLFVFLCVFIPNVLGLGLKIMLGRARPDLWFESHMFGFYLFKFNGQFWSCPSGHTLTITGLLMGVGFIWPRFFYVLLPIALMVVSTRLLLCKHYLSDVLSGILLTLIVVSLGYKTRLHKWYLYRN